MSKHALFSVNVAHLVNQYFAEFFVLPHAVAFKSDRSFLTLVDLLSRYHSDPLIQAAFEKGILKGGKAAFQYYVSTWEGDKEQFIRVASGTDLGKLIQLFEQYFKANLHQYDDPFPFLKTLRRLKDPEQTIRILKTYFPDKENAREPTLTTLLTTIDQHNNDEELIKQASPFFVIVSPYDNGGYDKVLEFASQMPFDKRNNVIQSVTRYLIPEIYSTFNLCKPLKPFIEKFWTLSRKEKEAHDIIWGHIKNYAASVSEQESEIESHYFLETIDELLSFDLKTLKAINVEWLDPIDEKVDFHIDSSLLSKRLKEIPFFHSTQGESLCSEVINKVSKGYRFKDAPDLVFGKGYSQWRTNAETLASYLLKRFSS